MLFQFKFVSLEYKNLLCLKLYSLKHAGVQTSTISLFLVGNPAHYYAVYCMYWNRYDRYVFFTGLHVHADIITNAILQRKEF